MAAFGARGAGYGLDAELARQREAKYDHSAENQARAWIEAVTGERVVGPFGDALRDGVNICKLVNTIKPGAVRKINESRMPFKQMENISNFLKSCRAMGVAEHSLFETVDLYEGKDIGLVVRCIFALGSAVQGTCPEYTGPTLGAKPHQENKRIFNKQQKQQAKVNASFSKLGMGSAHSMEHNQCISKPGICFGAENAGAGDTTTVGKLAKGSHGIQERLPVNQSRSITFGNDKVGTGDTTTIGKLTQGSHGIQERLPVDQLRITTFGNDKRGTGDTKVMTKPGLSSYGIMDRNSVSKANDVTFCASASQATPLDGNKEKDADARASVPEKPTADCPVSAAMSPLVFGCDAVENNNRSWFQARSG
ncbi:unnamed protein product [Ectocarpus sp. 13 AM-2016]